MKKITILIPLFIMSGSGLYSCSKKHPKPITYYKTALTYPNGSNVLIMPVDSRIAIKSKISYSQKNKFWKSSVSTAEALQNAIPSYLLGKNYKIDKAFYWSGAYSDIYNKYYQAISPKEYAALLYSLANYSYSMENEFAENNVKISPFITKKLSKISDYTFYTASWSVIKFPSKRKFKMLLRFGAVLLMVALVVVIVLAVSGGGGDGLKKLGKSVGNLFNFAFKGVFSAAKKIPVKSILKNTLKVARTTTKVATRVSRLAFDNGFVQIQIPLDNIEPVDRIYVTEQQPLTLLNVHTNPYLGVRKGVSFLPPFKQMKNGYMLAFVLVHNKTAKVVWSSKIWIPENIKTNEFNKLIRKTFDTLPKRKISVY